MPTIPKFHEVFIPMLTVLSADGELRREELKRRIRDEFYADLPEELLSQRTSTGHVLIMNRMGWAVSYLKKGKFVAQPKRGYVQITDKGRAALATKKLSLKDLKNDPDYLAADLEKHSDRDTKDSLIPTVDETPQDLIDQGFATIRDGLMADLLERLKTIDPFYFEKVILILLKKMGYGDFVETKKTGDGGGGGTDSKVASTLAFPFRTSYLNQIANSSSSSFSLSGTLNGVSVTGSGTTVSGRLSTGTFEGVTALTRISTLSMTLTDGKTSMPLDTSGNI